MNYRNVNVNGESFVSPAGCCVDCFVCKSESRKSLLSKHSIEAVRYGTVRLHVYIVTAVNRELIVQA